METLGVGLRETLGEREGDEVPENEPLALPESDCEPVHVPVKDVLRVGEGVKEQVTLQEAV